ncbi:hypothetical protein BB021_18120 [Elizabethkingia ursingii]|uniref:DUF1275 domain-containing protein n=2 Tax=Elizabethkingia ursingii TaxID=1756150 RepID=A0ABX3NDD6_9FLAO|nr:hypothetical protein BB021_18120 [Elizabethkingia ursingii]
MGIIYIHSGINILVNSQDTYSMLGTIFSLLFIVAGSLDILFCVNSRSLLVDNIWYAVGGIISAVTGMFMIVYVEILFDMFQLLLGYILLLRSSQLLNFSMDFIKVFKYNGKKLIVVSACGAGLGLTLIFCPLVLESLLGSFTAVTFIVMGIVSIMLGYTMSIKNK